MSSVTDDGVLADGDRLSDHADYEAFRDFSWRQYVSLPPPAPTLIVRNGCGTKLSQLYVTVVVRNLVDGTERWRYGIWPTERNSANGTERLRYTEFVYWYGTVAVRGLVNGKEQFLCGSLLMVRHVFDWLAGLFLTRL